MKYLSDSGSVALDIRVDYGETLYRKFKIDNDNFIVTSDHDEVTVAVGLGTIADWTYYDAEFLIWIPGHDKNYELFNFSNGGLVAVSDEIQLLQDLDLNKGVYKYHFKIETPTGQIIVVAKGDFIYKKE